MRVVVIGAGGQLGHDLMKAFADVTAIGVDHQLFDIEIPAAVSTLLALHKPDIVLNTAAFHNVELCETRPDRAIAINALAVDQLAAQCAVAGVAFAHVSTDYVFDGIAHFPYDESATPNPLNVYGISKLTGEFFARRHSLRTFLFRTSGLYGIRGSSTKGHTFIGRIIKQAADGVPIRVVTDVVCSPSYTAHVASTIRAIVEREAYGLYHVTNSGACSWHAFASEIIRQVGSDAEVTETTSDVFPSIVRRPKYTALAHAAIERLRMPPPPRWQDGIAAYLAEQSLQHEAR